MEEFAIKNYVYHNLSDILLKVSKIYPELFTEDIVSQELERLKNYVNRITFLEETINDADIKTNNDSVIPKKEDIIHVNSESSGNDNKLFNLGHILPNANVEIPPSLKLSSTPKGCDNETLEVALGCKRILDPTLALGCKRILDPTVQSKRCIARVLSNTKQEPCVITDGQFYGRQCKNIMSPNSEFCSTHKKHNPYGIFREEPSAEVKKMFEKKYKRVCENTE